MSTTGSWIFGRTQMRHKTHGALIHGRLKFNEANYTIVNYYQHFPQGCHTGEGFCLLVGFASGLRELNPKWAKLFAFSDVVSVVSEDCAVFMDPLLSGDASGISGYLKGLAECRSGFWLSLSSKDLSKTWPDQFKPFETGLASDADLFSGHTKITVLRFALRGAMPGTSRMEKERLRTDLQQQISEAFFCEPEPPDVIL